MAPVLAVLLAGMKKQIWRKQLTQEGRVSLGPKFKKGYSPSWPESHSSDSQCDSSQEAERGRLVFILFPFLNSVQETSPFNGASCT